MRAVNTPQVEITVGAELLVVGRVSLEAFDEFGPLGRAIAAAGPRALVLEDELTELGRPLACPYTPAEHLL